MSQSRLGDAALVASRTSPRIPVMVVILNLAHYKPKNAAVSNIDVIDSVAKSANPKNMRN